VGDYINGDEIIMYGNENTGKVVNNYPLAAPAPTPRKPARTVLLLMSNPGPTPPLQLGEEWRAIYRAIHSARDRDQLELRYAPALRRADLQPALLDHEPVVVHFGGHNSRTAGIVLADDYGRPRVVPPAALGEVFAILGASIRCVVLNACYTKDQAHAIAAHVPCVVGMSTPVLDHVAIEFATGFYHALANGQSVADAFRLGRNELAIHELRAHDPVLVAAPGVAENTFVTLSR